MMEKTAIDYLVLSFIFGSAFLFLSYWEHAEIQDWPAPQWPAKLILVIKLLAFITMLLTVGIILYLYHWWSPFVIFILGTIYGFLAIQLLGHRVIYLAITGIVAGWLLSPVYFI